MTRDVLILAFVGSLVLSFIVSIGAGGALFFAATVFLYSVAFLAMALGIYASVRFWSVNLTLVYGIAVPVAAVLIVFSLSWLVGDSVSKFCEVRLLTPLLLPFLAANAGAYWWVSKNKI